MSRSEMTMAQVEAKYGPMAVRIGVTGSGRAFVVQTTPTRMTEVSIGGLIRSLQAGATTTQKIRIGPGQWIELNGLRASVWMVRPSRERVITVDAMYALQSAQRSNSLTSLTKLIAAWKPYTQAVIRKQNVGTFLQLRIHIPACLWEFKMEFPENGINPTGHFVLGSSRVWALYNRQRYGLNLGNSRYHGTICFGRLEGVKTTRIEQVEDLFFASVFNTDYQESTHTLHWAQPQCYDHPSVIPARACLGESGSSLSFPQIDWAELDPQFFQDVIFTKETTYEQAEPQRTTQAA